MEPVRAMAGEALHPPSGQQREILTGNDGSAASHAKGILMEHARIDTPDGFRIVHADGTEPDPRDTAGPMLHLLPKLFVGTGVIAACPSPRVACTASIVSRFGAAAGSPVRPSLKRAWP